MPYTTRNAIQRIFSLALGLSLCLGQVSVSADQALLEAAKKQDWKIVTAKLTQKLDINERQADGTTALAWAVYWDNLDVVKKLLTANADVNIANDLGITPLMLAIRNRNTDMVSLLLRAGAKTDMAMWTGETPLLTAARIGQYEHVELLIDYGADLNAREPRGGQTALMWAISFRHPRIARLLIEYGANVNTKTFKLKEQQEYQPMVLEGYAANVVSVHQGGYTPLMFAARNGDLQTASLLIKNGANVNDISEEGSALVIATARGHEELALFLLEEGADPNISADDGLTPLHYSMRDGLKLLHGYVITASTMVCGYENNKFCRPVEATPDYEKALLTGYGRGESTNVIGIYIQEVRPSNREEFLSGRNMYNLAEALLARGADVNAEMKYPPPALRLTRRPLLNLTGATPLFLASASYDLTGLELLLEHGADPLIKTEVNDEVFRTQTKRYGDSNEILGNGTPLLVALGLGKRHDFSPEEQQHAIQVAERLIELGADVNEATATGWTHLHAAAYRGADEIIKFLVKNGAEINVKNGCGRTPLSLASTATDLDDVALSVAGVLYVSHPRVSTRNLLISLGANDSEAGDPVGTCILGGGGLIEESYRRTREIHLESEKDYGSAAGDIPE